MKKFFSNINNFDFNFVILSCFDPLKTKTFLYLFLEYGKAFDWPIYCEEVGCLPVPYDFFSDVSIILCRYISK